MNLHKHIARTVNLGEVFLSPKTMYPEGIMASIPILICMKEVNTKKYINLSDEVWLCMFFNELDESVTQIRRLVNANVQ